MPMVAVAVWMRLPLPGSNTESSAPVTRRKPLMTVWLADPASSTREPLRAMNASRPTTKTISALAPVVITSPGLISMPCLAGKSPIRTSPRKRAMPFCTESAASARRNWAIPNATAAPPAAVRNSQFLREISVIAPPHGNRVAIRHRDAPNRTIATACSSPARRSFAILNDNRLTLPAIQESPMFDAISIPFGAKMLFNTVKLKPGVSMDDVEIAIGEMCNVVKQTYGGEKGGFIAGQVFKFSGFVSDEGSLGATRAQEHVAIVTYWRSFEEH